MKRISWRSGLSEAVSFIIIVPCIVMLIMAILSAYLISTTNQQLLYTAYSVGRAAVVCETRDLAENRADAIMEELYGGNFRSGSGALNDGEASYYMELVGTDQWTKGSLLRCTVSQHITPAIPFMAKTYSKTLVMMIENGTEIMIQPDEVPDPLA